MVLYLHVKNQKGNFCALYQEAGIFLTNYGSYFFPFVALGYCPQFQKIIASLLKKVVTSRWKNRHDFIGLSVKNRSQITHPNIFVRESLIWHSFSHKKIYWSNSWRDTKTKGSRISRKPHHFYPEFPYQQYIKSSFTPITTMVAQFMTSQAVPLSLVRWR